VIAFYTFLDFCHVFNGGAAKHNINFSNMKQKNINIDHFNVARLYCASTLSSAAF